MRTVVSRGYEHRQRGVTMVEALVALVVLSTGMLGIASLYVSSLRAERTAQIRTLAVGLVSDMIDRIRANAPAREFYAVKKYPSNTPVTHDCVAAETNCSVEQLAEDDLARWLDTANKTLPDKTTAPKAMVEYTAGVGSDPDRFRVAVAWLESGQDKDITYENNVEILPVKPRRL